MQRPLAQLHPHAHPALQYKQFQYLGALVVGAGIIVALIPQLTSGNTDSATTIAIWSAVLVLSCVPMTLSSVYKEMKLGDIEIDPIFLNVWVCVFQVISSFPLLVPMVRRGRRGVPASLRVCSAPYPVPSYRQALAVPISISDIPSTLLAGAQVGAVVGGL